MHTLLTIIPTISEWPYMANQGIQVKDETFSNLSFEKE